MPDGTKPLPDLILTYHQRCIHPSAISQEVLINLIRSKFYDITLLKLQITNEQTKLKDNMSNFIINNLLADAPATLAAGRRRRRMDLQPLSLIYTVSAPET